MNAADIQDLSGNPGAGSNSISWLMDTTPPVSTVDPLSSQTTSTSFTVSVTASDPSSAGGSSASGVASIAIYDSTNGGAFKLFTTVAASQPSATFSGVAGDTYSFYSIATDNVGNVQPTPTSSQATTQIVAPAILQFAASQFTANVTQGTASVVININRSGNLSATFTVEISTSGGTDVAEFAKTISFASDVTSQSVTIPIINNGQAGQADERVALALSSPSSGAMLGATASTTLVIHDNNPPPPPLVSVASATTEMMKVGKGKKAMKELVLVLQFSGVLNQTAAGDVNAYDLAPLITLKATGKGKNRKPATTKLGSPVPVASAVYSSSNNEVTLTPRTALSKSKPEELIVNGALLTDTLGRDLDGADSGTAGSDYIATIKSDRLTIGGIPLARTANPSAAAVDVLLATYALADIRRRRGG